MKQFEYNILLGLGTNFFSSLPAAMPVIILTVILVSNGFSIKLFNVCNLLFLRNNSLSTHIFLSHSKLDYIISMGNKLQKTRMLGRKGALWLLRGGI